MTDLHTFPRYQVLFTVLINANTYGATIDVTQDIDVTDLLQEISTITNEIDNGDYDIGVFTFGDITLKCKNHERKFSPSTDWRSIFPYQRDKTKVDIKFYDGAGNTALSFRGLINDDATVAEITGNDVKFRVLSLDSILRQVQVSGGAVASTQVFSSAIKSILNVPEITNILTYSPSNITVDIDLPIDNGDYFTDKSAKDALDEILIASNSILYVDKNDVVYVKPRSESTTTFEFFGRGDPYGRENILKIASYNSGVQRAFSSVKINEVVKTDEAMVGVYGFRQKAVSMDFITNSENQGLIAQNILDQFKVPKEELEIEVPIRDSQDIELLDKVKIDFGYRHAPADGETSLPLYGVAEYGVSKYPNVYGSYKIDPSIKWNVIGIKENPRSLTKSLKLRVAGKIYGDGVF